MPPNARPSENPKDIVDGTCKWKPSECSVPRNDLAHVEPKKAKVTMATGKIKPLVIMTAASLVKSVEKASKKSTISKSLIVFIVGKKRLTCPPSLDTSQPADVQGYASMTTISESSAARSFRHSVEIGQVEDENCHACDISPSSTSQLLESSGGSNDNHVKAVSRTISRSSSIIGIYDDLSDKPEEAEGTERGMTHESTHNVANICHSSR